MRPENGFDTNILRMRCNENVCLQLVDSKINEGSLRQHLYLLSIETWCYSAVLRI